MTEALSQNLETNVDIALDMLTVNAAPMIEGEVLAEGEFSNLINTISANIEETQTNFVDLAVKSNVSSINQLALNSVEENSTEKDTEVENLELISSTEVEAKIATLDSKETIEPIKDTALTNEAPKVEVSNEDKEEKTEQKAQEASINFNILNITDNLEQIKTVLDEVFLNTDSIEKMDKLSSSIDNILSLLDETTLSTDEKNSIKEAFEKVQKLIEKTKEKIQSEEEIVNDGAKKILDGIVLKLVSKNASTESKENYTVEKNSINLDELKAIVKQSKMISTEDLSNELQSALNNAQDALSEVMDAVLNNDTTILENAIETLGVQANVLQNALSENEENNEEIIELNKTLTKALEVLNKNVSNDDSNLQELSEEIKSNLDNLTSFNQVDTKKVLNLLEEFKSNDALSEDDKVEIENLIKQISTPTETSDTVETYKKQITTLSNEVLDGLKELLPQKEVQLKTMAEIKPETKAKVQVDTKAEPIKAQDSTKATLKDDNFIEKISDEMVLEAKLTKIPANSGALSVSDEVAKMAMNDESTALNSTTNAPIQSHIIYDNGVVKNNAVQLKEVSAQEVDLETNVLNQITDKLSELKGAQGNKLTLVLRPNDLGRVSIELKSDANGLTTNIIAQNSEVRSYIEKNIHNLRQSLNDSGINVNNIQIKTVGEADSTTYEGNKDSQQQQQEQQQNQQEQRQNQKEKRETLANFSNFENQFKKDFSTVLNKTISYNLN